MFTFASLKLVRSVSCRQLSSQYSRSFAPSYSPVVAERRKTSDSSLSNCDVKNCSLVVRLHNGYPRSSELYKLSSVAPSQRTISVAGLFVPVRLYQTKSKDCNKDDDDSSDTESKAKNILDDIEFESILKDFAQDFGVSGDDANKLLEEVKEGFHSTEGKTEKPESATPCDNTYFKTAAESSTVSHCVGEQMVPHTHDCNLSEATHVEEIREDLSEDEFFHVDQELERSAVEYDTKRGREGVYDIDQLVEVLKEENLVNISVIQVPAIYHYADYLVLATAKSPRHCQAVVEFLIKLYKKKKNRRDPFVICEGKETTTWKALDMGNIVLHVFLEDTRNFYDIESLWLLDSKYDSGGHAKSKSEEDTMQWQLDFLNSLNPQ